VFKPALIASVVSIELIHNHASEDPVGATLDARDENMQSDCIESGIVHVAHRSHFAELYYRSRDNSP
jgi:hypothetical protein